MVSVFDHGLLYGDGCFEGIRAYNGRIFKLRSHLERMYESADRLRLTPAYPIDVIDAAVREAMQVNELSDAYIRLVFTRGVGTLGLNPFQCPKAGTVIIADTIALYPEELYETGLAVIVANRPRIPIPCLDPAVKSLNYLNNILAKVEAIDAGVLEAIMLNMDGEVAECTGDNLFIVNTGADGTVTVSTPPTDAGILHGITRQFVIDAVGPGCDCVVEERTLLMDDVLAADEIFLTGTAAEVIGVVKIDEASLGDGTVGPVTRRLTAKFRELVGQNAPED